LFERAEADELFTKLSASINPPGINPVPLQKLQVTAMPAPMPPPAPSVPAPGQPGAPGAPMPPAGGSAPQ
jgi:hypothetical protein